MRGPVQPPPPPAPAELPPSQAALASFQPGLAATAAADSDGHGGWLREHGADGSADKAAASEDLNGAVLDESWQPAPAACSSAERTLSGAPAKRRAAAKPWVPRRTKQQSPGGGERQRLWWCQTALCTTVAI
eukprot:SM000199S05436  [mRNA]  locus=s199:231798:232371:- [translate_table: standard]